MITTTASSILNASALATTGTTTATALLNYNPPGDMGITTGGSLNDADISNVLFDRIGNITFQHMIPFPYAMPNNISHFVKSIQVYNNRVVKLTFIDDTVSTAVCSAADEFSLETGISICLTKRMLDTDQKRGSSQYNKMIKSLLNKYEKQQQDELEKAKEKLRKKLKWQKAREKKELRRKRKEERTIEMQKEAYIRAMNELKDNQS